MASAVRCSGPLATVVVGGMTIGPRAMLLIVAPALRLLLTLEAKIRLGEMETTLRICKVPTKWMTYESETGCREACPPLC